MSSKRQLSGAVIDFGSGKGLAVVCIRGVLHRPPPAYTAYVLVTDAITHAIRDVLSNSAAIVVDNGDVSSPLVSIIKEQGIPCIVGTKYATMRINEGDYVIVDTERSLVEWTSGLSQCVFCDTHPGARILQTDHFFAMYDGYPVREGHLLLIPRRHVEQLTQLSSAEFTDLYVLIQKADRLLRTVHGAGGYNIGVNIGGVAGQTVPHLHIHMVPRKTGDVQNPRGGIRNFLPNPLAGYPQGN